MVNRRISPDLKECTLQLWDAGWDGRIYVLLSWCLVLVYFTGEPSLTLWHGQQTPSPLKGQTRIITRAILTAVHQLYETTSDLYLDELIWWLALYHDIVISHSGLQQNLQQAGLTRKLLQKLALKRDAALRLEWKEFVLEHGEGQEGNLLLSTKPARTIT
jgi:hypothetical protein